MKQAIMCPNCETIKRVSESYKVNIKEVVLNTLTGIRQENEYQTRMCKSCAEQAGYKVRRKGGDKV